MEHTADGRTNVGCETSDVDNAATNTYVIRLLFQKLCNGVFACCKGTAQVEIALDMLVHSADSERKFFHYRT